MADREEDFTEDLDALSLRVVGQLKVGGKGHAVRHFRHVPLDDLTKILALDGQELTAFERNWARLKILAPTLPEAAKPKVNIDVLERWLHRAGLLSPPAGDADEAAGAGSSASSTSTGPSSPETPPGT